MRTPASSGTLGNSGGGGTGTSMSGTNPGGINSVLTQEEKEMSKRRSKSFDINDIRINQIVQENMQWMHSSILR